MSTRIVGWRFRPNCCLQGLWKESSRGIPSDFAQGTLCRLSREGVSRSARRARRPPDSSRDGGATVEIRYPGRECDLCPMLCLAVLTPQVLSRPRCNARTPWDKFCLRPHAGNSSSSVHIFVRRLRRRSRLSPRLSHCRTPRVSK